MFCVFFFSHFPAFFDIAEDPSKNHEKVLFFLFFLGDTIGHPSLRDFRT